ncbi:MAG: glycerol-3-phosphate 1-O-acyltransferase PlsY [Pseudomonadota bacterium]
MPDLISPSSVLILWAAIAYVAGSIPFGLVLTKAMGLGNLREVGSGNIGATNVLRTGSKKAAVLTLLLDAAKVIVVIVLALSLAAADAAQVAALFGMIGHCFPVWLMFRGGKGVATFFGVLYALAWPVALATSLTWIVTAAVFRYSSLAALVAAASTLVWSLVLGAPQMLMLCAVLVALIFWRHAANIRRLVAGEESKIGAKG